MKDHHLHEAEIARVLSGEAEGKDLIRDLLAHLVAICPDCRSAWRRASLPVVGPEDRRQVEPRTVYASAFSRVLGRVNAELPALTQEKVRALRAVADLVQLPEREQSQYLQRDHRFATWGVCDLLVEESLRATLDDATSGESLARLAVSVANRLNPVAYGERFVADTQALAWACLGNARRVNSDLRGADDAMSQAEELLEAGIGDPLTRGQVLALKASLLRDQRRLQESQLLLEEVLSIYRSVGDENLEGRTLVQMGLGYLETGEPLPAIPLLHLALERIDPEHDPRLVLSAYHCLALCLIDCDRVSEAAEIVEASSPLYRRCADFSARVRRRWLEGRLATAYERFEEAEVAFLEVRQEFLSRNIGYDAALVSLDLAALYASRGMTAEVKTLAEEMLPIFEARDIHREAAAALIIFQQAARAETVTLALTRQLTEYLRRSRRDPGARCEIQVA